MCCSFNNRGKIYCSWNAQTIWIKQQLSDFGIMLSRILILCDNTSAINLTKNLVMHSRTNHIEIKHNFLSEHIANGNCEIKFIGTELQLTDLFTKPLHLNMKN